MEKQHEMSTSETITSRLFNALDIQTTALIGIYGCDPRKWPAHMIWAVAALQHAAAAEGRPNLWPVFTSQEDDIAATSAHG